jgi:hypothetical protein
MKPLKLLNVLTLLMSEATSGVVFPHIAALMRATMSAARQPSLL